MPLVSERERQGQAPPEQNLALMRRRGQWTRVYKPPKYILLSLPLWLQMEKKSDRDWPSDTITFMYPYVDANEKCRISHYSPEQTGVLSTTPEQAKDITNERAPPASYSSANIRMSTRTIKTLQCLQPPPCVRPTFVPQLPRCKTYCGAYQYQEGPSSPHRAM